MALLHWVCGALLAMPAAAVQEVDASLLRALASPDAVQRAQADRALASLGPAAARAALDRWIGARPEERRAWAQMIRELATDSEVVEAIARLDDPDAEVRRALIEFLGDLRLRAPEPLEARIAALSSRSLDDPSDDLRALALRQLARIDDPRSAKAIERCIDEAPAAEAVAAARALGEQSSARARVVERVQAAFERSGALRDDVLATLLAFGYGRALAELASGGAGALDFVPFVLGARHRADAVRDGSRVALSQFVARLRFLGEFDRADRALAALAGRGLDDAMLELERIDLALRFGANPARAEEPASALIARFERAEDDVGRRARIQAHVLRGAAQFASMRIDEAVATFELASRVAGERIDDHLEEFPTAVAYEQVAALELAAVTHLWLLAAEVARDRPLDLAFAIDRARSVHELCLRAELARASASEDGVGTASLSTAFEHPLGIYQLLLVNDRNELSSRDRRVAIARRVCEALASVAPDEMAGFDPLPGADSAAGDFDKDPVRLALMTRLHEVRIQRLRLHERRAIGGMRLRLQDELAKYDVPPEIDASRGYRALRSLRDPSQAALRISDLLRQGGQAREGLALAQRFIDDLAQWPRVREGEGEFQMALAEIELGGAYTDADQPQLADQTLNQALKRLEALERTLAGDAGLQMLANARAEVLTSLAVNANVKLREPDKALEYFERSIAIRETDFSRILLACYRARAGRAAEARALLAEVPVAPPNYYNIACTYALLGEVDIALDFLTRDFEENRRHPGALARQRDWARGDPDLDALRDDPRFQALVSTR